MKYVLVIAGSDSSGGAGIQADIKIITCLGAHALTAVTALTAQNSLGISDIHAVPTDFLRRQVDALLDDVAPDSTKIGMLATGDQVRGVADLIRTYNLSPVVLDPVLRATTGPGLLAPDALDDLRGTLLPLVQVVTPNLDEAESLTGRRVRTPEEMEEAARIISAWGPMAVVTGGHLDGEPLDLVFDGTAFYRIRDTRIDARHTHGTGCVFSSALAAFLATDPDVPRAARRAHDVTREAILQGYPCGKGGGPVRAAPRMGRENP